MFLVVMSINLTKAPLQVSMLPQATGDQTPGAGGAGHVSTPQSLAGQDIVADVALACRRRKVSAVSKKEGERRVGGGEERREEK